MAKNLGFKCACGHMVFASTSYFGEEVTCDSCRQRMRIPFGFYRNHTLARLYPFVLLVFMIAFGILYVRHAPVLGRGPGTWAWRLPLWLIVLWFFCCYYFPRVVIDPVYQAVTGRNFLMYRGHAQALRLDEIALFTPLVVFVLLAWMYWTTYVAPGPDRIARIRGPWIFLLIGTVIATLATILFAWCAIRFAPKRLKRI